MRRILIFLLPAIAMISCTAQKPFTAQQQSPLETVVSTFAFKITAQWAYPFDNTSAQVLNSLNPAGATVQGNRVLLDSRTYTLEVKNDSLFVNLPYFGTRQIGGGLPGNTGIEIKQPLEDLKVSTAKKEGEENVRVRASQNGESYEIAIKLFASGNANVVVNSTQRQGIRYTGNWE